MQDSRWWLVVAHRERLLRMARRRCATPQDAEDVVQEALLRAASFEELDEERLGQFLTSITVRLCVDSYRQADRVTRTVRRMAPEELVVAAPDDAVCRADEADLLVDLLARLPDRQRAVLVDRARGLSVAQIGRRHELSYKAAESALARARLAMRLALASTATAIIGGALHLARVAARLKRSLAAAAPAVVLVLAGAVMHQLANPPHTNEEAQQKTSHLPAVLDRQAIRRTPPELEGLVAAHQRHVVAAPPDGSRTSDDEIVSVPVPGYNDVSATDSRHEEDKDPVHYAQRCADEGVWIQVRTARGADPFTQGCGRERPGTKPDSIDVFVDVDELIQQEGLAS